MSLVVYLQTAFLGFCTGISFIDSTPLNTCHNCRIHQDKVFTGCITRWRGSLGWFSGFNPPDLQRHGRQVQGGSHSGNFDDRNPIPALAEGPFGKLSVTGAAFCNPGLNISGSC